MAMTTKSSIRVKPRRCLFDIFPPGDRQTVIGRTM
jgi:hypothetical protein